MRRPEACGGIRSQEVAIPNGFRFGITAWIFRRGGARRPEPQPIGVDYRGAGAIADIGVEQRIQSRRGEEQAAAVGTVRGKACLAVTSSIDDFDPEAPADEAQ